MPLFEALVATLEGTEEGHMALSDPLKTLFPHEMRKELLGILGGGAVTGAAYSMIVDKVDWFHDQKPWKEVLLAAGMGLVGGGLLWKRYRKASEGVMGAASGILGVVGLNWAQNALGKGAAASGTKGTEASLEAMLNGVGQLPEEQELLGLGDSTRIEMEERVGGKELAASVAIEEESPLAGWAGGY